VLMRMRRASTKLTVVEAADVRILVCAVSS
jgi:hypothetical protein